MPIPIHQIESVIKLKDFKYSWMSSCVKFLDFKQKAGTYTISLQMLFFAWKIYNTDQLF